MSTCRSCGAEVTWAVTTTGKRMPVDAEPSPDGNVTLLWPSPGATPTAHVGPAGRGVYTSHFATCPHAAAHRKAHR